MPAKVDPTATTSGAAGGPATGGPSTAGPSTSMTQLTTAMANAFRQPIPLNSDYKPFRLSGKPLDDYYNWVNWSDKFTMTLAVHRYEHPEDKMLELHRIGGMLMDRLIKNSEDEEVPDATTDDRYLLTIAKIRKHFSSPGIIKTFRSGFDQLKQGNMSMDKFITRIYTMIKFCHYTAEEEENVIRLKLNNHSSSEWLRKKIDQNPEWTVRDILIKENLMRQSDINEKQRKEGYQGAIIDDEDDFFEANTVQRGGRSFQPRKNCYNCGRQHGGKPCPARFAYCYACGEKAHWANTNACKKQGNRSRSRGRGGYSYRGGRGARGGYGRSKSRGQYNNRGRSSSRRGGRGRGRGGQRGRGGKHYAREANAEDNESSGESEADQAANALEVSPRGEERGRGRDGLRYNVNF